MKTSILMTLLSVVLSFGLVWAVSEIAYADGVAEAADAGAERALLAGPATSPPVAGPATSPTVAPDPGEDPGGFFAWTYDAVRSKNGWLLGSGLVVVVAFLLRLGMKRKTGFLGWFGTDRGGVVLAAILSTLMGFAHATAAGHAPGWPFAVTVLQVWVGAMGVFVGIKKLAKPSDQGAATA